MSELIALAIMFGFIAVIFWRRKPGIAVPFACGAILVVVVSVIMIVVGNSINDSLNELFGTVNKNWWGN